MNVAVTRPEKRGITVRLGQLENRGIQQIAVINRNATSKRSLHAEPNSNCVCPTRSQIGIDSTILPPKEFAHTSKYIAAIVKRCHLQQSREIHSRFQINNRQCISTDRNRKRVKANKIPVLITEQAKLLKTGREVDSSTVRNHEARTGLLIAKSTKRRRTT